MITGMQKKQSAATTLEFAVVAATLITFLLGLFDIFNAVRAYTSVCQSAWQALETYTNLNMQTLRGPGLPDQQTITQASKTAALKVMRSGFNGTRLDCSDPMCLNVQIDLPQDRKQLVSVRSAFELPLVILGNRVAAVQCLRSRRMEEYHLFEKTSDIVHSNCFPFTDCGE